MKFPHAAPSIPHHRFFPSSILLQIHWTLTTSCFSSIRGLGLRPVYKLQCTSVHSVPTHLLSPQPHLSVPHILTSVPSSLNPNYLRLSTGSLTSQIDEQQCPVRHSHLLPPSPPHTTAHRGCIELHSRLRLSRCRHPSKHSGIMIQILF
jgi:hypothetical protein